MRDDEFIHHSSLSKKSCIPFLGTRVIQIFSFARFLKPRLSAKIRVRISVHSEFAGCGYM